MRNEKKPSVLSIEWLVHENYRRKKENSPKEVNLKIIVDKKRVSIDFTMGTEISEKCYNKIQNSLNSLITSRTQV